MAACDICVELTDIMTPQSFSSLVTILVKYLIYEKQLIPFPVDRLKLCMKKFKELNIEENQCNQMVRYRLESNKYFKKLFETISSLETVLKYIENEFNRSKKNHIESVVILIGPSILNPLTVFKINVPVLSYTHNEKQHSTRQHLDNVFRHILIHHNLNDILTSNIIVETNLYVMFKVKKGEQMVTDWCIPKEKFHSFRGNQVVLKFDQSQNDINSKKYETCCIKNCTDFEVFVDFDGNNSKVNAQNSTFTNNVDWYLGKYHVPGFKNHKFNGVPILDTWLNPNILDNLIL